MNEKNELKTYSYTLKSSSEVSSVVSKLRNIKEVNILIHIVSIIHNTVLVQNLDSELKKIFPLAKIIFLKTKEKETLLNIYTLDSSVQSSDLQDELINTMQVKLLSTESMLKNTQTKQLKSYFTDQLTGLSNIYQLRRDILDNEQAGLILLKIDNFVTINNFYGFVIGDYVIEKISEYIEDTVKEYTLYRHTGAEFILLLENNKSFYEMKDYLSELYDRVKNFYVEYQNIKINIEFTFASCSNTSTQDIFSKVSMALKYASENNLPFWIYEDRMHFKNEYEQNLKVSTMVREAVEDFRIVPYFQPIVDNKTMKITKFECLARLIDEEGNVISPNLFISVAKKIKVYNLVTKIIINKSFEAFADNKYEFNVNLSIEDIMSSEIFDFILEKLKHSNVASRLTFELLESEAIKDFNKVDRFIKEVKRFGAKIAIDDFGAGYSNFAYITNIDVDFIKIDGSLISNIDTNKNSYMVVESIVDFAKKFKIKIVAEYVHSSTVMDKVKELGIDYSQGFYIDKPLIDLESTF
ncbi:MAG: GGDEF domain-containing phosphodiesterase [Sulfurimonas sp.]|nr:GGDEF domain-containing phosphodiesterase [Sulfurimonas sp.]